MTETKDVVRAIEKAVEAAAKKGATLDFEKHLPKGKTLFTNRELMNAVGQTLTEIGIPNNLFKKDGDEV